MSNQPFKINGQSLHEALADADDKKRPAILKRYLQTAIKTAGSRRGAAALLGVTITQFYRWAHEAGLNISKRWAMRISRSKLVRALADSENVGLCAWCQSYYHHESGLRLLTLTKNEFEKTRHDGTSHGICGGCKHSVKLGRSSLDPVVQGLSSIQVANAIWEK